MSERLCVVMPVYNEQDAIGPVLKKWNEMLTALGIDFTIRPYNDGSKDNSLAVMRQVAADMPRVDVRDKPNGGHGHTILTGYRQAAADGFDWVFQIDSDDEMGPEKFGELWSKRGEYDFLVGYRDGRLQALPRKVISFVSRCVVRLFFGKSIWDVNTPYRLMRVSYFKLAYSQIPERTFAPNVILSGIAANKECRRFEMPVPQHDRTTGEVSIKKWKLLKAAAKSFAQTIGFGWCHASSLRRLAVVGFVALVALAAASVVQGFLNGLRFIDFQWLPSRLLLQGENPYQYTLKGVRFCGSGVHANQVPSCLALLLPFAALPRYWGNALWAACNLFFTGGFLFFVFKLWFSRSARKIDDALFIPFALFLLAGSPWRVLIGNGQHLMFSLCFFAAALYACERKRAFLGGVLLALSAFKYTTIAPLAFIFLWRKEWTSICVAAAIHVLLTVASGIYLHESPVALVLQSFEVGHKLLLACGSADVASVLSALGCERAIVQMFATVGYVVCGFLCCSVFVGKKEHLLKLSVLAVISNMMFYHRGYDFVTLVFPLAYVMTAEFISRTDGLAVALRALVWFGVAYFFFASKVVLSLCLGGEWTVCAYCGYHVLLLVMLLIEQLRGVNHDSRQNRALSAV